MGARRILLGCLMILGILGLTSRPAAAEDKLERWTSARLPLNEIPPPYRDRVRQVVDKPTLYTHGPAEEFPCRPELYFWFLDHPDRAIEAWRRLGARCMDITDRGNGRYGWHDDSGNEVHWDTVYRSSRMRIWYAEGSVRTGPLGSTALVQAVVVLRHIEGQDETSQTLVRHQADMMLYTDSRAITLATRLFGTSASRLAEDYVNQLERFFSALACYLGQHPEKVATVASDAPTGAH